MTLLEGNIRPGMDTSPTQEINSNSNRKKGIDSSARYKAQNFLSSSHKHFHIPITAFCL